MTSNHPLLRAVTFCAALMLAACAPESPIDPRVAPFAALPDWNGIWLAEGLETAIDGYSLARQPKLILFNEDVPWNDAARTGLQALMA